MRHSPPRLVLRLVAAACTFVIVAVVLDSPRTGGEPIAPTSSARESPTPARSVPSRPTLSPGRCTSPTTTTRQLVDNYLGLTTSGDAAAVRDCFAAEYITRNGVSTHFATAGPILNSSVTYMYALRGCEWFRVIAEFRDGNPDAPVQTGAYLRFVAVGLDGDSPRIQDQATALVTPEQADNPNIMIADCR